ncbi:MAG: helix-turn-helix domain-containing protein [Candidatus Aminicenantales bacterium]
MHKEKSLGPQKTEEFKESRILGEVSVGIVSRETPHGIRDWDPEASEVDPFNAWEKDFRLLLISLCIEYFFLKRALPLKEFLDHLEKTIIMRALEKFKGNQKRAADELGLKYTTLNEKIKRHNIRITKKIV